jgi:hypothetical protein
MTSPAFKTALQATGYLDDAGKPVPGLHDKDAAPVRLRAAFRDPRVGLEADAIFFAQGSPTAIFKDAGGVEPDDHQLRAWHEAAWNIGIAPMLWIVTPTDIRLYDCYAPASRDEIAASQLGLFSLASPIQLAKLEAQCGRLATETGAFWSSDIGKKIDRRHRVDRELLDEINALEQALIAIEVDTDVLVRRKACELAQRFIGRCIFTWYLLDRGLAQPFLPSHLPPDLNALFANPDTAFALFEWLRETFNGDLFPMDDQGAEREKLTEAHLALIREFIDGRSLVPENRGQGRLFKFRFNAIPIDLISSIYQQFARSSAADEADAQGLHYTPVELVHLTLDPVFEGLPATARVLDPACGSGAFLVESFRRLVWKSANGQTVTRQQIRSILYGQLFGIDINRAALGIAAFSLYLAALEFDDEPIADIADLKFDKLIGSTLFECDSIAGPLPSILTDSPFEAIVGNPPWTFVSDTSLERPKRRDASTLRPRRSPDQAFLALAADLAGESGKVGMIMKATPFFSSDPHAIASRISLLTRLDPCALINLSPLRREKLFPDAQGPALLFFSRCALSESAGRLLVGTIPWTADFRRTGTFHVGPSEIKPVPLDRVIATPPFLKAATFGTVRDGWLVDRLQREFDTFEKALDNVGARSLSHRGQGFKVHGQGQAISPTLYFDLNVLVPDEFTPFRLTGELKPFHHASLHRPRSLGIFTGPLLICPKGGYDASTQRGRYGAAVSLDSLLYTENFFGISFRDSDDRLPFLFNGILNSSLTSFQLALAGPIWGLERPTVGPSDLLDLRVPDLLQAAPGLIDAVLTAEARVAADRDDQAALVALDDAVYDLYGLEEDERILATESVDRARGLIFENRRERVQSTLRPDRSAMAAYANRLVIGINRYLRARNTRYLSAEIVSAETSNEGSRVGIPGIAAIRLVMNSGPNNYSPHVGDAPSQAQQQLSRLLKGTANGAIPPYLNERRQLRIYGDDDLFVVKPAERRYWTETAGLNDADLILADHWLQEHDALARR